MVVGEQVRNKLPTPLHYRVTRNDAGDCLAEEQKMKRRVTFCS